MEKVKKNTKILKKNENSSEKIENFENFSNLTNEKTEDKVPSLKDFIAIKNTFLQNNKKTIP